MLLRFSVEEFAALRIVRHFQRVGNQLIKRRALIMRGVI